MRPGDVVSDRFEIEHLAGSGGMGSVWRALDRWTGGHVALKVLHAVAPEGAARFVREASLLSELHHTGFPRYVAHGANDASQPFLAMEWLEGESLSRRLARSGLTVDESLRLAARTAEALGAAHARGVVHRDVKPSNLLLVDGGLSRVVLLDFGVAHLMDGTEGATQSGALLGTPGYMAPEQARGQRRIDARADVFSLGCVLFKCLTGQGPFEGPNILAVLTKLVFDQAPRIRDLRPELPAWLDDLVARMLSSDRAIRPADGYQVGAALEAAATPRTPERFGDAECADTPVSSLATPPRTALGERERRLYCVVMASPPDAGAAEGDGPTRVSLGAAAPFALDAELTRLGARIERLANGAVVATVASRRSATDQAVLAARCALRLAGALPDRRVALATGRGIDGGRTPLGEVVEEAAALLDAAACTASGVRIDDVTAHLLAGRFDVWTEAKQQLLGPELDQGRLAHERAPERPGRTLLGRPSPCVGRDRELATFEAVVDEAVRERSARALLVVGAPGMGKSRLREELVGRLAERPTAPEIWLALGDPIGGSPLSMLSQLARRAAGIVEGEAPDERRRKLRARIARHVPSRELARIVAFVGELAGVSFPDEESVALQAARHDAMLMGEQIRRAFEDWVGFEAAAGPLVLVLEDLHWADLPTVKLVDAVLRRWRSRPLVALALARPEVHETFPGLWRERPLTEVRLGELGGAACERLVRHALGERVSDATVALVVERAAGNALYLEELIRAVAEGKGLTTPETVLAMLSARIEALDAEARRTLRAASVFGEQCWRGGVAALLGGERADEVGDVLEELADREVMTRLDETRFAGEVGYAFRHALVRDAAYAMLPDDDRRLGHRLAAEWLEAAGETDARRLAEHFERGGSEARASRWWRRAAELAVEGHDFDGAIERAERALAYEPDPRARGALLLVQAEAHRWRFEIREAEACAAEAIECFAPDDPAWLTAACELARDSAAMDRPELSGRIIAEMIERAAGELDVEQAIALARIVGTAAFLGRADLEGRALDRIERLPPALLAGDAFLAASVGVARAARAAKDGDFDRYVAILRESIDLFDAQSNARAAELQRINLGSMYVEMGAFDLAEPMLRETAETAERTGLLLIWLHAAMNLALVRARRGALEEARDMLLRCIDAAVETDGERRVECFARCYLARTLSFAGDLDGAEREARRALSIVDPDVPWRASMEATLAHVLLLRGQPALALGCTDNPMRTVARTGQLEECDALLHVVRAEALHAVGRLGEARDAIRVGRARLLERAGTIADPERRRQFVEGIAENARTMELARAWLDEA